MSTAAIDEAISSMLSARERRYLGGMKRARRRALTNVLRRHSAKDCVDAEVPLRLQVLGSSLPEDVRYDIFRRLDHNDSDKFVTWVHKALSLPLRVYSTPDYLAKPRDEAVLTAALQRAQRVMDTTMEGQSALKQEVLRIICGTAQSMEGARNYALGLEGPPGCGKTHFAKHGMARALQRPFVSIPLGGATDASNLLGTAYFYEGSKEGRLAEALVEARCCNPVVHFDEVRGPSFLPFSLPFSLPFFLPSSTSSFLHFFSLSPHPSPRRSTKSRRRSVGPRWRRRSST